MVTVSPQQKDTCPHFRMSFIVLLIDTRYQIFSLRSCAYLQNARYIFPTFEASRDYMNTLLPSLIVIPRVSMATQTKLPILQLMHIYHILSMLPIRVLSSSIKNFQVVSRVGLGGTLLSGTIIENFFRVYNEYMQVFSFLLCGCHFLVFLITWVMLVFSVMSVYLDSCQLAVVW